MKFNVSADLTYQVYQPSTIILNIHALRSPQQTVLEETFTIEPYVKAEELFSVSGENRYIRLEITEPGKYDINYRATVDNAVKFTDYTDKEETPVAQLDNAILPYLYPSRYCQSDRIYRMAHNMFGWYNNPFEKVSAVMDWINLNIMYLSGSTTSQTSAVDTMIEQSGVCRDFAHLGIAFCRALTIPARYFTGYAYQLKPADFHACFEAYIGGEWILFDATRLAPLNGLVKIATGRDAADTAVASIFGNAWCETMKVDCVVTDDSFEPVYYNKGNMQGLTYL